MKIKILVGVLVLLIVINLAAIGAFFYVQSRAPRPEPRLPVAEGRPGPEHLHAVGELDREERIRLFETMRAFHEETRGLAEETRVLEDRLIAAMNESPVPRAQVDSLLGQIAANRLEIARRATDRIVAMGDSLSPDQRERIVNAIMRMRGPGGPGGPRGIDGPEGERMRRFRRGQRN